MDRFTALQQAHEWMAAGANLDPTARLQWVAQGMRIQAALGQSESQNNAIWLNNEQYAAYNKEQARLAVMHTFYAEKCKAREEQLGFVHEMKGGYPADVLADPEWQFYRNKERLAFKAIQDYGSSAEGKAAQKIARKLLPDMGLRMAQLQVWKKYRDSLDATPWVSVFNPSVKQFDSAAVQASENGLIAGSSKDYMEWLLSKAKFKTKEITLLQGSKIKKVDADCYGGLALVRQPDGASKYSIYFANPFKESDGCALITDGFATRQAGCVAMIRLVAETDAHALNSGSPTAMQAAAAGFKSLLKDIVKSKGGVLRLVDPLVGLEFEEQSTYDNASGLHSDGQSIATKPAAIALLDSGADQAEMVLYHGSNSPDEITEIKESGGGGLDMGGLFMSPREDAAAAHGKYIYEVRLNPADVLTQADLDSDVEWPKVKAALLDAMSWIDQADDESVLQAWSAVIGENKNAITADLFQQADEASAGWAAQAIRGKVAKAIGYKAVEMDDEHGTSYLVFAGVPITAINAPESKKPPVNDLQWLDDAYADPSSILNPAVFGAFTERAATDDRVRTEQGVKERFDAVVAAAYKQMLANGVNVAEQQLDSAVLAGQALGEGWTAFADGYNSLKIPRVDMPQIKHEDHDGLIQFLADKSITHEAIDIPAQDLYPTQLEFSPAKVEKAKSFMGENGRPVLISSCNHVLDGHHAYAACYDDNKTVSAIRFNAPILELLQKVKTYPKVTDSAGNPFAAPTSHDAGSLV